MVRRGEEERVVVHLLRVVSVEGKVVRRVGRRVRVGERQVDGPVRRGVVVHVVRVGRRRVGEVDEAVWNLEVGGRRVMRLVARRRLTDLERCGRFARRVDLGPRGRLETRDSLGPRPGRRHLDDDFVGMLHWCCGRRSARVGLARCVCLDDDGGDAGGAAVKVAELPLEDVT